MTQSIIDGLTEAQRRALLAFAKLEFGEDGYYAPRELGTTPACLNGMMDFDRANRGLAPPITLVMHDLSHGTGGRRLPAVQRQEACQPDHHLCAHPHRRHPMKLDKWTIIKRDGEEIEINVEFDMTPMVPATYWQPAEGGEIEIYAVFKDGVAIDPPLTDAEDEKLLEWLYANTDDSDWPDDEPDWDAARDRMIDDRLTGDA